MGTDYEFRCDVCEARGGWFTRQAWGWGNADILECFAFIMEHTRDCEDGAGIRVQQTWNRPRGEWRPDPGATFPHSWEWGIKGANPSDYWLEWVKRQEDTST